MHIPRATARRLDRLARAAHAFHRYAHHPLCDRYAGEVLAFGRKTRVCRGCALTVTGAVLGLLAGLVLGAPTSVALGVAAAAMPAALVRGRRSKVWSRLVPSAALSLALATGLASASIAGALVASVAVFTSGAIAMLYRGRGPDRTPCTTCPEQVLPVCRGVGPIVRRERAYQRVAARMLPVFPQGAAVTSTT